jgi:hypothetical protein
MSPRFECLPKLLRLMSWLLVLTTAQQALAHSTSTSFVELTRGDAELTTAWVVNLRDLELPVGLDTNFNGAITLAEFRAARDSIKHYAAAHIALIPTSADGSSCSLFWRDPTLRVFQGEYYAHVTASASCTGESSSNVLAFSALFATDSTHRAIATVVGGQSGEEMTWVFSPDHQRQAIASLQNFWPSTLTTFVAQGIIHILLGYDHLLFLLALLIPIVLEKGQALRRTVLRLVQLVTAFTVGHSITLAVATLFSLSFPVRWVEAAIALSVVLAGINIAWPLFRRREWQITLCFGLLHGFGFASVLSDLLNNQGQLALVLFSFNVGVELGQLLVLFVVVPALALIARGRAVPAIRLAASTGSVLVGCFWLWQRVLV